MESKVYTPEIVWTMLADVAERQKETDRLFKESKTETDRLFKESKTESDRQMQELRESQKETDRILTEKFDKTDQLLNKLTENVKNLNNDVGGMENSTGSFAEEFFYNCFKNGNQTFFGEHFDDIKKNVPGGKPHTEFHDEYDIVLYNSKTIAIIEVKFRARKFNVDDTIDKVRTFRAVYPEYNNHQIYLALAAMSFFPEVEDKCKDYGIAIVKQEGNMVVIVEDKMTAF